MDVIRRHGFCLLIVAVALAATAGCAALPSCGAPIVGLDDIVRPGRMTLFGEQHGTREIPAFMGDTVCQSAAGGPVRLALEVSRAEQPRIDAYLTSKGDAAARAALLEGAFWHREFQDGRSSAAMADLIERIRGLRAAGRRVEVLAFDVDPDERGSTRDAGMAKRILDAYAASPADRFLVLAGNVHTRTTRGVPWDAAFEPMGLHLVNAGRDVVSLDVSIQAGTAWMCFNANASECGPKQVKGNQDLASREIERLPSPSPEGFLGRYGVGPVRASPPALQQP